jgi:SAM-dependent methyltransferase
MSRRWPDVGSAAPEVAGSRPTSEAWEAHAEAWARWARTPGHDHHYEHLNLPAFLGLLPGPGRLTLDIGCGEGRLGRALAERGHVVVGVDSSPTLAALARQAGGYREVLEGQAGSVALPDGCADLVVAFMTLHDMDELEAPVLEAARLLEPGGRLCLAVPHPFAEMDRQRAGDRDYFTAHRYVDVLQRDGVSMTFESWRRPLSAYASALEQTGFLIETIREPVPGEAALAAAPELAKWRERPIFLHVRAVLSDR